MLKIMNKGIRNTRDYCHIFLGGINVYEKK